MRSHRYRLLKEGYQFINFDSQDMYHQLQTDGFVFSKERIEPFFRCKSDHDMLSYGQVYFALALRLIEEKRESCAVDFMHHVFEFLDKTEKRSLHYEQRLSGNHFYLKSDEYRYRTMAYFVLVTLNQFMRVSFASGEPYLSFAFRYIFKNIKKSDVEEAKERAMKTIEEPVSPLQGLRQKNNS